MHTGPSVSMGGPPGHRWLLPESDRSSRLLYGLGIHRPLSPAARADDRAHSGVMRVMEGILKEIIGRENR